MRERGLRRDVAAQALVRGYDAGGRGGTRADQGGDEGGARSEHRGRGGGRAGLKAFFNCLPRITKKSSKKFN